MSWISVVNFVRGLLRAHTLTPPAELPFAWVHAPRPNMRPCLPYSHEVTVDGPPATVYQLVDVAERQALPTTVPRPHVVTESMGFARASWCVSGGEQDVELLAVGALRALIARMRLQRLRIVTRRNLGIPNLQQHAALRRLQQMGWAERVRWRWRWAWFLSGYRELQPGYYVIVDTNAHLDLEAAAAAERYDDPLLRE